ncbi:family 1 extracellular solute-binding protein [Natrialba magadii ATCC 43099]|uniref:Family 1 extracellular solute-binding protein n=1 Tax=Natrialba magadii (strain ATCC 43099 / DSM 3394 / CCM 3739 / CIP 104546 / IAM 13178 / JCM 8861 / NBRC 102185 / NCIMB 2190 / MS3) TaxID=547559 RepID=L9V0G5_NATMM|nr:family 1 extracellular solute-binding protein [Natrialba magadii ATCC 43099]
MAVAGCISDDTDGAGQSGESGGGSGNGSSEETYEVGYGDYRTTVNASAFPDELRIYAVQTGWSNWDAVMENFESEYGVPLYDAQGSSGEALTDARSNAGNQTHSAFNGGYSFALEAMNDGLTTDYKPANWDVVPDELKTDNGHVVSTRQMTTAVTYRVDIYEERGLDAPETWEDLKHPDIAQDLAFTPPHTANGLASALSVNRAYGGSMANLDPVIEYHEEIADHGADIRRNIEGDVTSGEISTVIEYDYSGLNMKYNMDEIDEEQLEVAILTGPSGREGAMNVPYGFGLLEGAPNPEAAKLFMDYVLSLEGQELFFDAFVRPIRADELEQPEEFPDQSDYDAAEFALDQEELVANQESIQQELTERTPLPGAQ